MSLVVDRWCPECGCYDKGMLPVDCIKCEQPMREDPFSLARYVYGDGAYPHAREHCGGKCIDHRSYEDCDG